MCFSPFLRSGGDSLPGHRLSLLFPADSPDPVSSDFTQIEPVPTPDGVWHKDSHYRSQLIGGVHKLMILIREKLEDVLLFFLGSF